MTTIEDTSPNCCEKGNWYISLYFNKEPENGDIFTGWGIHLQEFVVEQAFYCPFCGNRLETIMTKWEHEVIDLHSDSMEQRKKALDRLEKDEWELVSVTKNGVAYFKRPIVGDNK